MERQDDLLLILVAALNQVVSNKLFYAVAVIDESTITADNTEGIQITKFTVLRSHTPSYTKANESNLLSLKMITNVESNDVIYIYDKTRIFCCQCKFNLS